ncbi:MAG TPA: gamma-glutamyltransferase [Burkholderiaceae bacterium]|mgnify:CR=1 FL=1|jgi:gamma-glutamyltranspeptidase/glutathione hydrolase|nr:gamma-glutamyltransferase [Burkholderiaceae bacterium]
MSTWRQRAGSPFETQKRPAVGSRGMVVTNHPLASAAGAEMLAAGGNAVDAAVSALFTLTVVEPMMVGVLGGGFAHIRLPDGRQTILEGQGRCPGGVGPTTFTPDPAAPPGALDALGRRNSVGRAAVATPGNLMAWCQMLASHGSLSLADVVEPAIRHASRGFAATSYLADCVADCAADMIRDPEIAAVFMPGGKGLVKGARVVNGAYADTLRQIVREGPAALYGGSLGARLADDMARQDGYLNQADLSTYRTNELAVLRARYRGFEITGPPPPCSGPLHIGQMLGILEGMDIAASGSGSADTVHLLAEVLKIAFADRAAATADPDFVPVPVERLLSAEYAAQRRAQIDPLRAQSWKPGVQPNEGANTTHLTVADGDGRIVCATQTINSLFGARYMVPGTGMIPNNYLYVFDPRPGLANSLAPGKRVTSSMSPLIVLKDGKPQFALGLPGGLRIFPSAMQAVINLIDHQMSLQEAVEAPRVWTQGYGLEIEPQVSDAVADVLRARGHEIQRVPNVGGGLCAIRFHDGGDMEGAACWRADGTPIGVSGGLARPGVRFLPEARRNS